MRPAAHSRQIFDRTSKVAAAKEFVSTVLTPEVVRARVRAEALSELTFFDHLWMDVIERARLPT